MHFCSDFIFIVNKFCADENALGFSEELIIFSPLQS